MRMRGLLLWLLVMFFSLTFVVPHTVYAEAGVVPDLSIWENTWFKLVVTKIGFHFENIGVKPKPSTPVTGQGSIYMKVTTWDAVDGILSADIYGKKEGVWDPTPDGTLTLTYFAGSDLKFYCLGQFENDYIKLGGTFVFNGKRIDDDFILGGVTTVKTLGGYYFEADDIEDSTERWAGSFAILGPMVRESKVPDELLAR